MRWPFSPQSSSIAPAPSSPGGFLNTEPNVRFVVGCVALRRSTSSRTVARISLSGRAASSRYSTAATTWPCSRLEWRYEKPELGAASASRSRRRSRRARGSRSRSSRCRRRRRSSTLPHPRCPGSRRRTRSRRARRRALGGGRPRSSRRRPRRASCPRVRASASSPASRRTSRSTPVVGGEHVRAETDRRDLELALPRGAQDVLELGERSRLGVRAARGRPCRSSSAGRARRLPRNGARSVAGSPSTIARAIFHGSPTPNVITRSPGRAQASASVAASSSDGAHPARTSGGSESTTSFPETPSRGASRAPMMSVTIAASASPSACPSSTVQLARALDDVRLVDGDHPAARQRPRRAQRHLELGRVVAVVVVDRDAAALADELEPPPDSGEPHDRRLGLGPRRRRRARAPRAPRRRSGGCARRAPRARARQAAAPSSGRPAAPSRARRRRRRAARPRTRTTHGGRARCS